MKYHAKTVVLMLAMASGAFATPANVTPAVVGDASMVIGMARLISVDGSSKVVERGIAVREGDRIETEAGGHVHLRFVDGGRISVRPSSRLQIESYSHSDSEPSISRIKFRLDEGVVRSITGTWGEAARDRFRLNTPVAAIGVKGTDFVVTADDSKTLAAVYTGAIVLAPLSDACQATLGPCQSGFEKMLSETMKGQMIALYRQDTMPQIVPLVDGLALYRNRETPTPVIASERSDKGLRSPATMTASISETAPDKPLIAESSIVRLPGPAATPTATPAAPAAPSIAEPAPAVVVSLPAPAPAPAPVAVVPPEPPQVKQLAWAIYPWTKPMSGDVLSQTLDSINLAGKAGVVSNGAYSLYRDVSASNALVSREATAQFRLAGGSGQLALAEGRILEPVQVTGGTLAVDFNRSTFDTRLNLTSATMGADVVIANGLVRSNGVMASQAGNAFVGGALSLDGKEAGYFFEKAVAAGNVTGLTLWGR